MTGASASVPELSSQTFWPNVEATRLVADPDQVCSVLLSLTW